MRKVELVWAAAIVAVLVSGLWLVVAIEIAHDRSGARQHAQINAANLARAFEEHVVRTIKDVDRILLHYRADPGGVIPSTDQGYDDALRHISIADRDGRLSFSTLSEATGISIADRQHFTVHKTRPDEDFLFISKPMRGRVTGRMSIPFSRKIFAADGSFAGVLVVSVDPEYFRRFYESIEIGSGGLVALVGMDRAPRALGRQLQAETRPLDALDDAPAFADGPPFDPAQPAVGFWSVSDADGVRRVGAYRRLKDHPLAVVVLRSQSDVFETFSKRRSAWIIGASVVSVLLFIGAMTIGWLVNRLAVSRRSLAEAEERWRLALEAVGDGVWDWNAATGRAHFSHGWKAMLGYADDEIGDRIDEWTTRVHPDDLERTLADVDGHLSGRTPVYRNEHRMLCADGFYKWILDRGMVVSHGPDGKPLRVVGTHIDLAERKALEEKLVAQAAEMERLATIDGLTGIANRRCFQERAAAELSRALRYERPLAVLMLDLDHFKKVNDTHGHAVGDTVLKTVAATCAGQLRQQDLLGRLGGEEFAVLLPETDLASAAGVAEKLRAAVQSMTAATDGGAALTVTVSVGVSTLQGTGDTVDTLLRHADRALYQAKSAGRNRVGIATPIVTSPPTGLWEPD